MVRKVKMEYENDIDIDEINNEEINIEK